MVLNLDNAVLIFEAALLFYQNKRQIKNELRNKKNTIAGQVFVADS